MVRPGADIETSLACRLFDHLVGAVAARRRQGKTKSLGGLEVDDQLVLRRA